MARTQKANADNIMPKPPLDPAVADQAPTTGDLTAYDHEHFVTYMRLLDADAEGADWVEMARIVLHIDSSDEPERARGAWESPLSARQMDDRAWVSAIYSGAIVKTVQIRAKMAEGHW